MSHNTKKQNKRVLLLLLLLLLVRSEKESDSKQSSKGAVFPTNIRFNMEATTCFYIVDKKTSGLENYHRQAYSFIHSFLFSNVRTHSLKQKNVETNRKHYFFLEASRNAVQHVQLKLMKMQRGTSMIPDLRLERPRICLGNQTITKIGQTPLLTNT